MPHRRNRTRCTTNRETKASAVVAAPVMMANARPQHCSMKDVDLHSKSKTSTPDIQFVEPEDHGFPIIVFRAMQPGLCATAIKFFHITQFRPANDPMILRIEHQALLEVDNRQDGHLVLLEHAAYIPLAGAGDNKRVQVRVLAILIPSDPKVRWFYSTTKYNDLFPKLLELGYATPLMTIEPRDPLKSAVGRDHHKRLFVWMREAFLTALRPPHQPDYITALKITDWAPHIAMSEVDAMKAIEGCKYLCENVPREGTETDLSDDRYLLELHPAERRLSSTVELKCAEYLFYKRQFFEEWYKEVMRTDKNIEAVGRNGQVRSDTAHAAWFEKAPYNWGKARARRIIAGWRALGLLDERTYLPWMSAGGMLALSIEKRNREMEQGDVKNEKEKDKGRVAEKTIPDGGFTPSVEPSSEAPGDAFGD